MQVLDTVNLNHIVTREGGWDTAADWKVRMMMLDMIMIMMIMVVIPVLIAQKQARKLQATLVRNYDPLTYSQGWSVELLT